VWTKRGRDLSSREPIPWKPQERNLDESQEFRILIGAKPRRNGPGKWMNKLKRNNYKKSQKPTRAKPRDERWNWKPSSLEQRMEQTIQITTTITESAEPKELSIKKRIWMAKRKRRDWSWTSCRAKDRKL
jgi:hypothetical protein